MPEGRHWPTQEDSTPQSARFWVPMNNPEAVTPIVVTETHSEVEGRLKRIYPLYKVARFLGFSAVAQERVNNEV